ncbi:MAG: hypothetical protein KAT77_04705 [Nanoarchaeota archaeon]|nr:hypothetical protein [Nanoarchaeota archaeon]
MSLEEKTKEEIDLLMCPKSTAKFAEVNPEGMTFCKYEREKGPCPFRYEEKGKYHCSRWYL